MDLNTVIIGFGLVLNFVFTLGVLKGSLNGIRGEITITNRAVKDANESVKEAHKRIDDCIKVFYRNGSK